MTSGINKWVRVRIILVALFLAGMGLAVWGRFFFLQIVRSPALRAEAAREYAKPFPVLPVRGLILDCRGNELAVSSRVESLVAHPRLVKDPEFLSQQLAPLLGLEAADLEEMLIQPRPFVWIKRHLTPEQAEAYRVWEAQNQAEIAPKNGVNQGTPQSIYLQAEAKRYYPHLTLAAPILGFCNIDGRGLEGMEYQFDRYLYGKPQKCERLLDARGQIVVSNEQSRLAETMGDNLVLTLDSTLQYIAEKELAEGVRHWQAAGGMVLVTRPQTGEILAMAQSPSFDPNRYQAYSPEARHNRLVTNALEPGSTFKIFIAASALDAGAARTGDRFHCENGTWRLGAKEVIHDAHPYGSLTLCQVIQKSSNIGAAKIAARCGAARLDHYMRAFGFGCRSNIGLSGENAGLLKNLKMCRSMLDRSTLAFGQGVSVTPLQLNMALAALGNDGVLMQPLLVKEIVSPHGRLVTRFSPRKVRQVISPQTSRQMLEIMQLVTLPGGTAVGAAPDGFTAAGKTGTAQKLVGRSYSHSKFNALFIGLVPAQQPALAISVIIDEPKGAIYGGVVAAPIFKRIAHQSLRVLGYYPQGPAEKETPVLAGIVPAKAAAKEPAKTSKPAESQKKPRDAAGQDAKPEPKTAAPAPAPESGPPPKVAAKPAERLKVMPDVRGLTMREVLTLLQPSGVRCQIEGSGAAISQEPQPGAPILPGTDCVIKFGSQS